MKFSLLHNARNQEKTYKLIVKPLDFFCMTATLLLCYPRIHDFYLNTRPYQKMENTEQITDLLAAWSNGDENSLERLLPMVEHELRRIARNYMRRENPNHTLQTTALVNEAYLKLVDQTHTNWKNRAQFFGISAQIMRRVLLNHARDRMAEKRGGGVAHVNLEDVSTLSPEKSNELIALDAALKKLKEFDALKSQIVEMRYFGGLTIEETAEVLHISEPSVSLHWRLARAWLQTEIRKS